MEHHGKGRDSGVGATSTYGTERLNAYYIMEDTLNLHDVRVYDTVAGPDGKDRQVLNGEETTAAQMKQDAIKNAFKDWIFRDPERRETLVALLSNFDNHGLTVSQIENVLERVVYCAIRLTCEAASGSESRKNPHQK